MMSDLKDFLAFIGSMFLLLFSVSLPIGSGAYFMERWSCQKFEEATGKQTKYTGLNCYVKHQGSWMGMDEYKYRFATRGAE